VTTIGVAIAVPEPWGAQLKSFREALGDSSARGIPTHITLAPPIEVEADSIPVVEKHLAEAAADHASFRVHLRGTGTFRPVSPVVFVVVVEGISGCEMLAFSVRRGSLAVELQFPSHPHVTVAHQLSEDQMDRAFAEMGDFECEFEADHFSLYVHEGDDGWRRARDFALPQRSPNSGP